MTEVPARDPNQSHAYEDFFRSHFRAVDAYVRTHYPDIDAASILSTTFETAWRRFDQIPTDSERGWIIGVARNCVRNELRGSRRRAAQIDALAAARTRLTADFEDDSNAAAVDALQRAFARLRPAEREVLLLAEWEGLSGEDLGQALGVSRSAAAVRLHRARAHLRELIGERGRRG